MKTNQEWRGRQAALKLHNNRWVISFLATTTADLTDLGGAVAGWTTPKIDEATNAMANWITSGVVPDTFTTHAPDWFTK